MGVGVKAENTDLVAVQSTQYRDMHVYSDRCEWA